MVRASKTMRLTGLNRLVKALVQSRYERGARISRASSSLFSSASSLSVRHSTVSHYSCCMVVAASPLTRRGRYLTAWWSIVASENGLIPPIRVELIREDPSLTYQASRTRAEMHETNALRGPPTPPQTTYASALTGASPGPGRQLITSMANIEKAIVSNLAAGRGRVNRVTFAKNSHGPAERHDRSVSTGPLQIT